MNGLYICCGYTTHENKALIKATVINSRISPTTDSHQNKQHALNYALLIFTAQFIRIVRNGSQIQYNVKSYHVTLSCSLRSVTKL